MSDTSQDTGKNMWDFVNEVESESPPKRPHRRASASVPPIARDVSIDDLEAAFAPEPAAAENPEIELPVEPVVAAARTSVQDAPRRRKLGGLIAAGIAVVALGATVFVYTQGTQTAQSASSATAVVAERISPAAASVPAPVSAPTVASVTAPAPVPVSVQAPISVTPAAVRFTDALDSGSPFVVGKSIPELVLASASLPPVAAMPNAAWRDVECSSCHTWTQPSLCDQGKWYESHGDAAVNRIGHPYGGGFKRGLQIWAKQGCQ